MGQLPDHQLAQMSCDGYTANCTGRQDQVLSEASALKTNTGRVLGKTKRKRKQNYFRQSLKGKFAGKTKEGSSKFFSSKYQRFLFFSQS